jgi:outer membrane protein
LSSTGLASAQKVLTLQDCINNALKNNWTYRSAVWGNKSAGNDLWSAWGRFLPRADLYFSNNSAGLGPTSPFYDNNGVFRPGTPALEYKSYAVGVSFSQVIFDGGANVFNLSSKLAAKNSSDYGLLFSKQNLIFQVKQVYFDLLKSKMLLEVQQEVAKRSEQQLKIAQSRFELGSASKSDFLKAKLQYGKDQLALLKAENQVQVSRSNLNAVMGQDVDQAFEVQEVLEKTPMSISYDECLRLAYKNHPSIRQSESDIDVAEGGMRAARAGYLPTVSVGGSRNWNASAIKDVTLDNIRHKDYRWGIGLTISFNLFEGFQTQNAYLNSRNQVKTANEKLEQAKSDVALEVKQAFLSLDETGKSISVSEQNVQAAEEDLNLVQEKYRLGAASILELLDAQVSSQTAKSDKVQALFDYNLAVARLERAIGK